MGSEPLLERLIDALRCLPGVGPKSAQRMALHLLERLVIGGLDTIEPDDVQAELRADHVGVLTDLLDLEQGARANTKPVVAVLLGGADGGRKLAEACRRINWVVRLAQSCLAWLMLRRKTFAPASINSRIFSGFSVAGPRVLRIFVFRILMR